MQLRGFSVEVVQRLKCGELNERVLVPMLIYGCKTQAYIGQGR